VIGLKIPTVPVENKPAKNNLVNFAPYVVIILLLVILPFLLPTYYLSMLTKVVIFAIFAIGLNLLHGYTGLPTLGQAAYLGISGYTVGILMVRFGISSFWILFPLAILMAILLAGIIGYFALRVKGTYFLLINLAFGELLANVAIKWRPMTGGTDGLVGIRYPDLGIPGFVWTDFNFYYLVFIVFVVSYYILYRIVHSSFGHALIGIRENELRMMSLGYNTWIYKYLSFIIAALFGGVAGSLFAPFYGAMMPTHLALLTSSMVMLMVAIGSPGVLWGPFLGALIVLFLEHFSSVYTPERWPLILGGVFVLCVLFVPGGISIYLIKFWRKIRA
jgi:branched-chain amino acid transport system permease protein